MIFSTKLALLFSSIILSISIIISYFVYTSNVRMLEGEIAEELQNLAFNSMDKVDRMFYERYLNVKVMATDPVISSRKSTPGQITSRLIDLKSRYNIYSSISFLNMNRVFIADTSGRNTGKQHGFTEYWPRIANGQESVMILSKSETDKDFFFHFALVVKDTRGPFGVIVARVPLDSLAEIIGQMPYIQKIKENFKMDLVDREGWLLYSNHDKKGLLQNIPPDWELVQRLMGEGKTSGTQRHLSNAVYGRESSEEEILVYAREQGFRDFKGNGWTLILNMPTSVAFAPAFGLRNKIILILTVMSGFSIAIVYLFSRRMTKPLKILGEASREIGQGNTKVRVKVESRDEIGLLSDAFNNMAESLMRYHDKLANYSAELESSKAELVEAQHIARLGHWDWDIETNKMKWSDETYRIFDLSPQELQTITYESFLNLIHPADRSFTRKSIDEAVKEGTGFGIDSRIALPGGKTGVVHLNGKASPGGSNPVRMAGTIQDITERKKIEDELERLAVTDRLTQVHNRVKFEEVIQREMGMVNRYKRPLSLSIVDIDEFKKINDTYGHAVGDYVIKTVVSIIRKYMRETSYLFRWGGDEFIMLIPEGNLGGSKVQAERIRKAIEDYEFDNVGKVTASFGLAQMQDGDSEDTLIKRADDALYKAKAKGRNCLET